MWDADLEACVAQPAHEGEPCDDGDPCTEQDACAAGTCVGVARSCDDGIACTTDACVAAAGGCVHDVSGCSCAEDADCDDGNPCSGVETCNTSTGTCQAGEPVDCSGAGDACHASACEPSTGACVKAPLAEGTPCDDGDACTTVDTCVAGTCQGGDPVACGADTCWTSLGCNPQTGQCEQEPLPGGTPCDDGDACTVTDLCEDGACIGTGLPDDGPTNWSRAIACTGRCPIAAIGSVEPSGTIQVLAAAGGTDEVNVGTTASGATKQLDVSSAWAGIIMARYDANGAVTQAARIATSQSAMATALGMSHHEVAGSAALAWGPDLTVDQGPSATTYPGARCLVVGIGPGLSPTWVAGAMVTAISCDLGSGPANGFLLATYHPSTAEVFGAGAETDLFEGLNDSIVVTRIGPTGQLVSSSRVADHALVQGVAAGPSGGFAITAGGSNDTVWRGGSEPPIIMDDGPDVAAVLGVFSADGAPLWARRIEIPGDPTFEGDILPPRYAPDGGLVIASHVNGDAVITGPGLPSVAVPSGSGSAGLGGLVVSFDASGQVQWTLRTRGSGEHESRDMQVDAKGIYIAGRYQGVLELGTGADKKVLAATEKVPFVGRIGWDGKPLWLADFPNAESADLLRRWTSLAVGPDGEVTLGGSFTDQVTFGAEAVLTAQGTFNGHLVRINSAGGLDCAP